MKFIQLELLFYADERTYVTKLIARFAQLRERAYKSDVYMKN